MQAMGFWILALGVGCSTSTLEDVEEDSVEVEPEAAATNEVAGTWQVKLVEARKRRLKIIRAALSSQPLREAGLGKLKKDEKDLYETWSRKQGQEARLMNRKLRVTKARFVIGEGQITVQVDDDGLVESFGPVSYEVLETAPDRTVLRFDPGMGNGFETHTLLWSGPDQATSRITANGKSFLEVPLVRVAGPPEPTPPSE